MSSFKPSNYPDGYNPKGNDKTWRFWDAFVNPITMRSPDEVRDQEPIHAEHQVNWGVKYTSQ